MRAIISEYTMESGVRGLKKKSGDTVPSGSGKTGQRRAEEYYRRGKTSERIFRDVSSYMHDVRMQEAQPGVGNRTGMDQRRRRNPLY